jgi:hypothetical protein
VYLLGDYNLSAVSAESIGGRSQKNEPHLMEMYAALACVDFFSGEPDGYRMIARYSSTHVKWEDLPYDGDEPLALRRKINNLTRFAFAYLSSYYPMLEDINKQGKGYRAPWYVNFFERPGLSLPSLMQTDLLKIKKYCESYLSWVAHMQTSASELKIELINYQAFAAKAQKNNKEVTDLLPASQFELEDFSNLCLPDREKDAHALTALWERMSEATVNDNDANGVGKFLHALYRECARD